MGWRTLCEDVPTADLTSRTTIQPIIVRSDSPVLEKACLSEFVTGSCLPRMKSGYNRAMSQDAVTRLDWHLGFRARLGVNPGELRREIDRSHLSLESFA